MVERLNHSIKEILKALLDPDWKINKRNVLNDIFEPALMAKKVQEAIEIYNNRLHKSLFKLTSNAMEAALFQKSRNTHPNYLQLRTRNSNTPEAVAIQHYKKTIINEYRGDLERFFIDWRLKQEKQHQEVIYLIKEKSRRGSKSRGGSSKKI